MKKAQKFYTVWVGRRPGVYMTWDECKEQVVGYENAVYKSFSTLEQAKKAFLGNSKEFIGNDTFETSLSSEELEKIGNPLQDSICVDGAFNTRTNEMEYQGVSYQSRHKLFHFGPIDAGTNNIAEFLAIIHALAYCKDHALSATVYSDSQTAISWVNKQKAKTKIDDTYRNQYVLSLIKRGEDWLRKNTIHNAVEKWQTEAWGENPADFGRK
ncbi:ribonuclease H1 domain-containing protein [Taibaiella koreensis]|uniref:ribonuclease H1 domain-containing protein n=1 Tax=Taibaiella koreensis TaxID=1268548 RepID=UPI000E59F9E2|nr:ribonuclease H family protein [Taibaiella koreensis]